MEIVLLENIKNLGKIGDVVNVKRGYGRNFLIKYGKALKAKKILLLKKMPKKFLILLIKKIINFLKGQKIIMNCMDQ